jgi:uncharacterized protein (DUF849 family)
VAETPVIIEAAINGVTSKQRNPHVPRQPDEIAADALACLDAGAAIVHNHTDVGVADGAAAAERYLEGWRPVLAERPDALVYPTVNFGADVRESYAHLPYLAESGLLRIGLCDPGSVNLGAAGPDGLPAVPGFVYANSYGDIHYQMELCAEHRLGPSMAIFEPGFLRTALTWWRAGRLPQGAMIKLYFGGGFSYLDGGEGVSFGLPPTRPSFDAYLAMLERCDVPWSVAVIGGDLLASDVARLALEHGGHLHVGLEDYAGARTPTNVELVEEAVALCAEVGRPVATCDQAATILALP